MFDFGSEMYVWTGKHVAFSERKAAIRLARELWETGYDYTPYQVNPLSPMRCEYELSLLLLDNSTLVNGKK